MKDEAKLNKVESFERGHMGERFFGLDEIYLCN